MLAAEVMEARGETEKETAEEESAREAVLASEGARGGVVLSGPGEK